MSRDPEVLEFVEQVHEVIRELVPDDGDPVEFISSFISFWVNLIGEPVPVRDVIPIIATAITAGVEQGRLRPLPDGVSVRDVIDYIRYLHAPGPDYDALMARWEQSGLVTLAEFAQSGQWKPGEEMFVVGVPSLSGLLASRLHRDDGA